MSHAASAFYPSPFNEAIILTADGVGEWATTTVALAKENKIEIKKEIHFPHSLGFCIPYLLIIQVLKLIVVNINLLAPYGEPKYQNLIRNNLVDIKRWFIPIKSKIF